MEDPNHNPNFKPNPDPNLNLNPKKVGDPEFNSHPRHQTKNLDSG